MDCKKYSRDSYCASYQVLGNGLACKRKGAGLHFNNPLFTTSFWLLPQVLAEEQARPMQIALDGLTAATEPQSHLIDSKFLNISQYDNLSVVLRKRFKCLSEIDAEFQLRPL